MEAKFRRYLPASAVQSPGISGNSDLLNRALIFHCLKKCLATGSGPIYPFLVS